MGFKSLQFSDFDGNPEGGHTFGNGFAIAWQRGPLGRGKDRREPNGAFVEDVIGSAKDRLEFYQRSKFRCDANEMAIAYLESALDCLRTRTADRERRNVEGTHKE